MAHRIAGHKLGRPTDHRLALYRIPIEDLNLSRRAYNPLWRSGLRFVVQVIEKSEDELLSLRKFSPDCYDQLKDKLNGLWLYRMPIEELTLSRRAYNCLRSHGLMTVGQLIEKSEGELLSLRSFGRKSFDDVKDKLNGLGRFPAAPAVEEALSEPKDAEAEDDEVPEWKRKLMQITGEEGSE